jgi:polyphosphate kinase 2
MSEKNSGKNGGKFADSAIPAPQKAANGAAQFEQSKNNHTVKLGKDCDYEKELRRLQVELAKLQEWIRHEGLRVVAIFEGRDAAGKGGAIKRITDTLNPRICRVVALGTPTEREKTQWYFQRYVSHLPAAGEMVLFDRSWYNRAGVERVMGFCTEADYLEFMRSCPEFERMLVRSGILLVKYWFSVSDEEQERRFQDRMKNPTKRWKLSPMDLESRKYWAEYSRAKDEMFAGTDIKQAPWYVVNADNKKAARLNVIRHLLSLNPYRDLTTSRSRCHRSASRTTPGRRSTSRPSFQRSTASAEDNGRAAQLHQGASAQHAELKSVSGVTDESPSSDQG